MPWVILNKAERLVLARNNHNLRFSNQKRKRAATICALAGLPDNCCWGLPAGEHSQHTWWSPAPLCWLPASSLVSITWEGGGGWPPSPPGLSAPAAGGQEVHQVSAWYLIRAPATLAENFPEPVPWWCSAHSAHSAVSDLTLLTNGVNDSLHNKRRVLGWNKTFEIVKCTMAHLHLQHFINVVV